jgi:hypothetical protein
MHEVDRLDYTRKRLEGCDEGRSASVSVQRKFSNDFWMQWQIRRVIAPYSVEVFLYNLDYTFIAHALPRGPWRADGPLTRTVVPAGAPGRS